MGSDGELNAKAAGICGMPYGTYRHEFYPCTNPADTAILKRAMREKKPPLYLTVKDMASFGWSARYYGSRGECVSHAVADAEERAVTAAAVAAWEGSK